MAATEGVNDITIVGGGIAGLSLGVALLNRGIPVRLQEASFFPRHRVCGEFISGVSGETLQALGVRDLLNDAELLRSTNWYDRSGPVLSATLPEPALGISRYRLDRRMAERLVDKGGELIEGERFRIRKEEEPTQGLVLATGRPVRTESDWIGLKAHFPGLPLEADLEMHLGEDGYLGLSRIEDGRVNACGLFRKRDDVSAKGEEALATYVEACGLDRLARRLRESGADSDSCTGVSAFVFGAQDRARESAFCIGDRGSIIPPFTGNGMSMAFQSAELAFPLLAAYSRGESEWLDALVQYQKRASSKFRRRLAISRWMHPILSRPIGQSMLSSLSRKHLLPFGMIYRATR